MSKPLIEKSLIQSSLSGINIQQGTTGNDSPIINSPISVGDVAKTISPEQGRTVAAFLSGCPNKPNLGIFGDQYSSRGPFLDELYALFSNAGWHMIELRPNIRMGAGPTARQLSQVSVTEYGEEVRSGESVLISPSDPAFCVFGALKLLGLTPTIVRTKINPQSFAAYGVDDGVYISVFGSALDGK